jgi:hypothetical protein
VDFKKRMKEDRQELKEKIINMVASDELDQARILELIKAQQKQVDDLVSHLVTEIADFHKSLSPEQRKNLADEIREHSQTYGFERSFSYGNH